MFGIARFAVKALPCPFCGTSGKTRLYEVGVVDGIPVIGLECRECGASGPLVRSILNAEAALAWNQRGKMKSELSPLFRGLITNFCEAGPEDIVSGALPCPFCTSTDVVPDRCCGDHDWFVFCNNCEAGSPNRNDAQLRALESWNARRVRHVC